jgi:hypothetical protein
MNGNMKRRAIAVAAAICLIILFFSLASFAQRSSPPRPSKPSKPMTAKEVNSFFGPSEWPFKLTLRVKSVTWNGTDPLVIDAVFTNTSKEAVFIDLKKAFQFNGFLDNRRYRLGHTVHWTQEGRSFGRSKHDHTEIPVGGRVIFRLTSSSISDALAEPDKSVLWSEHEKGSYKFFLNYVSMGKTVDFPGQWVGQAVSNTITILVK